MFFHFLHELGLLCACHDFSNSIFCEDEMKAVELWNGLICCYPCAMTVNKWAHRTLHLIRCEILSLSWEVSCRAFALVLLCYYHIYFFQVKAFSRSLDLFKTAIVVGGTNISEQVRTIFFVQLVLWFHLFFAGCMMYTNNVWLCLHVSDLLLWMSAKTEIWVTSRGEYSGCYSWKVYWSSTTGKYFFVSNCFCCFGWGWSNARHGVWTSNKRGTSLYYIHAYYCIAFPWTFSMVSYFIHKLLHCFCFSPCP